MLIFLFSVHKHNMKVHELQTNQIWVSHLGIRIQHGSNMGLTFEVHEKRKYMTQYDCSVYLREGIDRCYNISVREVLDL